MATRQRKAWKPESNGQYTRNLGWKLDEKTGKYTQHKFYLGTDLKQAERRKQRLEELWEHIERTHTGEGKPTWDSMTLKIAKALARGEVQIVVERQWPNSPEAYARYLHRLATAFPMVSFVPEDATKLSKQGVPPTSPWCRRSWTTIENQKRRLQKSPHSDRQHPGWHRYRLAG